MILFADPLRVHGATDPFMRQVTISQGTFLELMEMAALAMGYRLVVAEFPDGTYGTVADLVRRPVAVIQVVQDPQAVPPALFAVVKDRRTAREVFTDQSVGERARTFLVGAATSQAGVFVGYLDLEALPWNAFGR